MKEYIIRNIKNQISYNKQMYELNKTSSIDTFIVWLTHILQLVENDKYIEAYNLLIEEEYNPYTKGYRVYPEVEGAIYKLSQEEEYEKYSRKIKDFNFNCQMKVAFEKALGN